MNSHNKFYATFFTMFSVTDAMRKTTDYPCYIAPKASTGDSFMASCAWKNHQAIVRLAPKGVLRDHRSQKSITDMISLIGNISAHELAHGFIYSMYLRRCPIKGTYRMPDHVKPHGREWQAMMTDHFKIKGPHNRFGSTQAPELVKDNMEKLLYAYQGWLNDPRWQGSPLR